MFIWKLCVASTQCSSTWESECFFSYIYILDYVFIFFFDALLGKHVVYQIYCIFFPKQKTKSILCIMTVKENLTQFVLFCFVKTKMILLLEAEAGVGSTPRKFSLGYWSCALLGQKRGQKVRIWKKRCCRFLLRTACQENVFQLQCERKRGSILCSNLFTPSIFVPLTMGQSRCP